MNVVEYFFARYQPRLVAKCVQLSTIADYRRVVMSMPSSMNPESAVSWLAEMRCPAATRNKRRRYLLAILRDAHRHGIIGPWYESLPKAFEYAHLPRAWRIDEFERILTACNKMDERYCGIRACLWWRSFLLALWYTGLRVQTLLDAQCGNLDLDHRTLIVMSTKDRREILYYLPDDADQAIRRIYWHRTLVWPWPFMDPKKTMLRRMRRLLSYAELPQIHQPFHAIRRSVASYVAAAHGVGSACEALGHSRESITRRYYLDPRIIQQTYRHSQDMPRPKVR